MRNTGLGRRKVVLGIVIICQDLSRKIMANVEHSCSQKTDIWKPAVVFLYMLSHFLRNLCNILYGDYLTSWKELPRITFHEVKITLAYLFRKQKKDLYLSNSSKCFSLLLSKFQYGKQKHFQLWPRSLMIEMEISLIRAIVVFFLSYWPEWTSFVVG